MSLTADILRPDALGPKAIEAWRAFQSAEPAFSSPLLSPEFAQAVGRARADAAVAVLQRDGRTVGFLAHHRRPGGLARPIGAVWSDCQTLIADPGAAIDGAEALAAAGIASFRASGLIDPAHAFDQAATQTAESHTIAFEGDAAAFWESRRAASAKRFKNLRRLEHKLEREVGEVAFIGPDHDPANLDLLFAWKSEQYARTGYHDVLASAWSRQLMDDLFARRDGAFRGLLLTLTVGGRPVAGHFGVRQGPVYHPWIAAFDPALSAYSPGWSFLAHAIAAMPGLGIARYELASGHDHYKLPLSNEQTVVRTGMLHARGPRPSVDGALALAGRALGPRRQPLVERVRRRLDHIAAAEPTLGGRLQGVATAIRVGGRRRGAAAEGEAEA